MKKLLLFLLVAISFGGGFYYYQKVYKSESFFPEFFLPENVLFYLNQKDFGSLAQDFKSKPLAQTVASIDFVKLALDLEFSFEAVNNIREFRDFVTSPQAAIIFEEFLTKQFSIAILQEQPAGTFDQFVRKNLLFFCKPKHGTTLPRLLGSIFTDGLKTKTTQYGEHVIQKVFLDEDTTIVGVVAEKMIIISLEEHTLRNALDRYDEKTANLSEDYFFQDLREDNSKSLLFSFFKIEQLLYQFQNLIGKQTGIAGEFISSLENLNGFTAGAFCAFKEENYSKNILKLYFNQNELNKRTAHFLSIKPEKESVINNVPENAFLYYWTNTFDLRTMWEIYASEYGAEDMLLNEFKKSIETMTGLPFAELLELPDNTINVMMRQASTIDLVPVPNFSLIFDMKDREKAEKTIQRLLEKNKIPHQKDNYRSVEYTYWGEDIQKGLQPVYGFYDTNLYISSSVRMQKEIIDTIKSGKSLVETKTFQLSAQDLLKDNNSCLFVELSEVLEVVKKVAIWGGTMIAIQNRRAAKKSKILVNGFILPLLDGLKMYATLATRSYTEKGVVTVESNIVLREKLANKK